jgi:hypothetical protein
MLGLSRGDSSQNYPDIAFALYLALSTVQVYEIGVYRGSFGTFVSGDRLRVAVEGGVVKYRKNGALLYTSALAPAFPLLVDTSLNSVGATLTDVVLSGELAWVSAPAPEFSIPGGHYDAPQSVVIAESDPQAVVHYTTNGADPAESDLVIASGASVLVGQNTTLKARAFKPGLIPSSVTTAIYTFGATVTEDVVWTKLVNAVAQGNDLAKPAGVAAWDAGAVSTKAIVSQDGYVECWCRKRTRIACWVCRVATATRTILTSTSHSTRPSTQCRSTRLASCGVRLGRS